MTDWDQMVDDMGPKDAQARLAEALQALREADDLLQKRAYLLAHGTVQRALVRLEEAE